MPRMNVYIPAWLRAEMDGLFSHEEMNWSSFFARAVEAEISRRRFGADAPRGLSADAVAFVVERLRDVKRKAAQLAEDTKYDEGRYEGFLWAKYVASEEMLRRVAELPPIMMPPVQANAPEGTDRVTPLPDLDGLLACLNLDDTRGDAVEVFARQLFDAHYIEHNGGEPYGVDASDAPGFWGWEYSTDGWCTEDAEDLKEPYTDESIIDQDIEMIYDDLGGCRVSLNAKPVVIWGKGFIEGAAQVYNAIRSKLETVTREPSRAKKKVSKGRRNSAKS